MRSKTRGASHRAGLIGGGLLVCFASALGAAEDLPTVGSRLVMEVGARAGTELSLPTDVAVGNDGRVYVVDSGRHRVAFYDGAGQPQGSFGGEGKGDGQ